MSLTQSQSVAIGTIVQAVDGNNISHPHRVTAILDQKEYPGYVELDDVVFGRRYWHIMDLYIIPRHERGTLAVG